MGAGTGKQGRVVSLHMHETRTVINLTPRRSMAIPNCPLQFELLVENVQFLTQTDCEGHKFTSSS